jgi:hypothetical protein
MPGCGAPMLLPEHSCAATSICQAGLHAQLMCVCGEVCSWHICRLKSSYPWASQDSGINGIIRLTRTQPNS